MAHRLPRGVSVILTLLVFMAGVRFAGIMRLEGQLTTGNWFDLGLAALVGAAAAVVLVRSSSGEAPPTVE